MTRAPSWHILTGEYPPQPGGVAAYTHLVARGLAEAGEEVHVWAPAAPEGREKHQIDDGAVCASAQPRASARGSPKTGALPQERPERSDGLTVHALPGCFDGRAVREIDGFLRRSAGPRRLLVQYVPHAFGFKAMNVGFCRWLRAVSARERIWAMFHEVCFPWGLRRPLKHHLLAAVTRLMARMVAQAAERIFVSIPHWTTLLGGLVRLERPPEWLPVPSNVATEADPTARDAVRRRTAPAGGPVIGHFGTFGNAVGGALAEPIVRVLREDPRRVGLLVGHGGERYAERLRRENEDLAGRLVGPGALPSGDLAAHLAACDVLLQPYPEGVTTRRGSVMAGLALGVPVIANAGPQTEGVWDESGAIALVTGRADEWASAVTRLLADPSALAGLGARGRRLYQARFSLEHTVEVLLASAREEAGVPS